jgi:tRNA A37 methylthiotransferase MiaB
MPDQVHPETITRRSGILRELAERKKAEFSRALVGTVREAVIEAESGIPGWRQATTDNYVTVMVPEDEAGGRPAGTLVAVEITDYRDGNLFAAFVNNFAFSHGIAQER